jgi:hypothetical protein
MKDVLRNLKKIMQTNVIGLYTFTDKSIRIDRDFVVKSTTNLPLGSEVTFIVKDVDYNAVIASSDDYYLINRYLLVNDTIYRRISGYNKTTGQITIASGIGVAVTTDTEMKIVVLDSLFINPFIFSDTRTNLIQREQNVDLQFYLTTKLDGEKTKMFDYIQKMLDVFNTTYRTQIPIYNEAYNTVLTYADTNNSLTFTEALNNDIEVQKSIGLMELTYYYKY